MPYQNSLRRDGPSLLLCNADPAQTELKKFPANSAKRGAFIGEARMALLKAPRTRRACTQLLQNAESARRLEQDKGVHRQRLGMLLSVQKERMP
jgi:hypothetical protein